MREELVNEIKNYGCKVEDRYHKTIYNINPKFRENIQYILEQNGYRVIEQRSTETTMNFEATSNLFKQIVNKYDLTSMFESIECFAEISAQKECSQMGSGAVFSISHKCGFHLAIDFQNHNINTLHFGDERTIEDYYGKTVFIDEIVCSKAEKTILEAIWKFQEKREQIRWLPSDKASKKCVEYRKLLKEWQEFNKILSEEWEHSTLIFGIEYSIERDIEYWEDFIQRESQKYII